MCTWLQSEKSQNSFYKLNSDYYIMPGIYHTDLHAKIMFTYIIMLAYMVPYIGAAKDSQDDHTNKNLYIPYLKNRASFTNVNREILQQAC